MRSPVAMERHAPVAPGSGVSANRVPANRPSLLLASVPARLLMVAVAAGLLWLAVYWALA
jgi:hypothetical protein